MPALANEQHESFAQAVVNGASLTEAAKRAGHKIGPANFGSRLMERAEIASRIIELQSAAVAQTDPNGKPNAAPNVSQNVLVYTEKPYIVTELVSLHRLARKLRDISGSNTALKTLAQIGGLLDTPRLSGVQSTQALALLGISEIHAMLTRQVGSVPRQDRAVLIEAAPELAELIESTPDVPQTPVEPSE